MPDPRRGLKSKMQGHVVSSKYSECSGCYDHFVVISFLCSGMFKLDVSSMARQPGLTWGPCPSPTGSDLHLGTVPRKHRDSLKFEKCRRPRPLPLPHEPLTRALLGEEKHDI